MFTGMQTSHAAIDTARLPLPQGETVAPTPLQADDALLLAANDTPVRLRVERKFNVLGKKKTTPAPVVGIKHPVDLNKDDSYPLFIVADHIEGRAGETTEADGSVELRRAGSLVFADKLTAWPLDDEIEASGNVRLLQDGAEIETSYLRMKMSEQIGFTKDADYNIVREVKSNFYRPQQTYLSVATTATSSGAPMMLNVPNSYGLPTTVPPTRATDASGHAERIDFEGENQIRLSAATYSTCKPGEHDWYFRATEFHLDYDRDVGDASNATLWFEGVPLFYTPAASFALNRQPRSGFLHPHFSTSTKNGLDVTAPLYWAIAPNYDATFFPRYMSKRGFQLGTELRYIDEYTTHVTRGEYLPNDDAEQRSRYAISISHQQSLGQGVSAQVDWNEVSDAHYWEDMSSRLMQTSQTQLRQQLALNYSPAPWLTSSLQMLHYQTLQLDPTIKRPYFLDPQFTVVGYKPDFLKTDLSLIGQYSKFTHPTQDQGSRFVFYPQLSLPIVSPAFQITPKVGLHMSKYDIDRQENPGEPTSFSRTIPTFTLDATAVFERDSNWLGSDYIQTLEPRLYYVNIPYKDQSKIPVFDSALTDFNFAQMFAENRYSGFDRINDANQLTAAVTSRLIDAKTGVERVKAMLGQRYYFKSQQVVIDGETARSSSFSNLVAAVNGAILPKTYADVAWEYNYRDGISERFSAGMRYQPELGKVLSASYRLTRDPLTKASTVDQIDFAGQWPLGSQWYAVGRYNYSLRDNKLLEAIAGFEYNASCWSARFVAQRLEATTTTANTSLFFQLELSDFGSIGANPIGLLRRTIPGYGKTNELPTSGSLLSP